MIKITPIPNKDAIHISFYDESGKLVTEHIPNETSRLYSYLADKYSLLLIRYNKTLYYWHIRHQLCAEEKKVEDLRFIDHVMQVHDGNPPNFRERRYFNKLYRRYMTEYDRLAQYIFKSERDGTFIDHPYTKAYIKMWRLDRSPEWKTLYHGVNGSEFIYCFEMLMNDAKSRYDRFRKRKRLAEKKLKTRIGSPDSNDA